MDTLDDVLGRPVEPAGNGAAETDGQSSSRLDRELLELLNELRVVLPGVQALFAFLLIVPFNERFASVTGRERAVYSVALLASALSCVLFISAPAFHRMRFRRHDKAQLLRIGNRSALAGMATLAVAMISAVFLVTEILFGDGMAALLTAGIAVPIGLLWWVVPAVFGTDRDEQAASGLPPVAVTERPTAGGG